MLSAFLQMLPLSLAGAVSNPVPVGILIIFLLLASKDRPLQRTWLFISGTTIFLIAIVIVEHYLLKSILSVTRYQTAAPSMIDIILGIILIFVSIFWKKKQKIDTKKKGSLWHQFVAGFCFQVIDVPTLVIYFAAVKVIFDAKLAFVENITLCAVNIIIVMSIMTLPPFLVTIFPQKSARVLDALNRLLKKRGELISKIFIVIIAFYLIYKGAHFFF